MGEIIHEALRWHTLPLTALLGVVGLYWAMVAIGLVDTDGLDVDLDADLDVDMHLDVDMDLDADVGSDHAAAHGAHNGGGIGDVGVAILKFVNAGEVPLTLVISMMALFMWSISMLANHYLNPAGGTLLAAGFLVGNIFASAVLTRVVTSPLKPLMRGLKRGGEEEVDLVGAVGRVKSGEVTGAHGQIEVEIDGSPALLQARVAEGAEALTRGDEVMVIDHEAGTQIYTIRKTEPIRIEDTE